MRHGILLGRDSRSLASTDSIPDSYYLKAWVKKGSLLRGYVSSSIDVPTRCEDLGRSREVKIWQRSPHQGFAGHPRQVVRRVQEYVGLLLQEHHDVGALVHL